MAETRQIWDETLNCYVDVVTSEIVPIVPVSITTEIINTVVSEDVTNIIISEDNTSILVTDDQIAMPITIQEDTLAVDVSVDTLDITIQDDVLLVFNSPIGATGNIGPAGVSLFDPLVSYIPGDTVVSGGKAWQAVSDVSASPTLPFEGDDWSLLPNQRNLDAAIQVETDRAVTEEGTLQTNINTKQDTLTDAQLTSFTEGLNTSEVDARVDIEINKLIDAAPGELDTLKELADEINSNTSAADALVILVAKNATDILTKQATLPVGDVGQVLVSDGTDWLANDTVGATSVPTTVENINGELIATYYDGIDGDDEVDYNSIRQGIINGTIVYLDQFTSADTLTLSADKSTMTLEKP